MRHKGLKVALLFSTLLLFSCTKNDKTTTSSKFTTTTTFSTTATVVKSFNVTFDTNGHGVEPNKIENVISLPNELPVLSDVLCYRFAGWYKNKGCTADLKASAGELLTGNLTLYAKWEEIVKSNNIDSYIDSLMDETSNFIPSWSKEGFKGRLNYIDGVFLKSLLECYEEYKDIDSSKANKYKEFVKNYVNYYISDDGTFIYYDRTTFEKTIDNALGFKSGELDSISASSILFKLNELYDDSRYLTAINYTYNELMKHGRLNESTDLKVNFEHKEVYANQIWLDGMYMYVPFYAEYAKNNSDSNAFEYIKCHYQTIREKMRDEKTGLYYHGYDGSSGEKAFWASENGTSKSFWLRSTGWLIASLVDSIEYFPEGDNRDYLIDMLNEAVASLIKYKDEKTSMFYQVIDKGGQKVLVSKEQFEAAKNKAYQKNGEYVDAYVDNYVETSGSSMVAYVLLKGARLGYLSSEYYSEGIKVFEGIYNHSLKIDGNSFVLSNICKVGGLGDSTGNGSVIRDGSFAYYLSEEVVSNDAKGVGPFIMAYVEYTKYKQKNA